MSTVNEDRERIRAYLRELLDEHDDHEPIVDDQSMIKSGRLDSLVVVKLVLFLETDFDVDFTRIDFDPERFDTVEAIEALVAESRG